MDTPFDSSKLLNGPPLNYNRPPPARPPPSGGSSFGTGGSAFKMPMAKQNSSFGNGFKMQPIEESKNEDSNFNGGR